VKHLSTKASDQPNIDRTPVRCFAELLRKQLLNEKLYSLRAQLPLQTINEDIASTEENLSRASVLFLSTLERYSKTYFNLLSAREGHVASSSARFDSTEQTSFTNPVTSLPSVRMVFDSGSNIHLLTLKDARRLFSEHKTSHLKVIGVSNVPVVASAEGQLCLSVQDTMGRSYNLDLGKAFAMKDVPMNLISVSEILKLGSIVHFENDKCYYQAHGDSCRIPLKERDGLFELDVNDWLATAAAATTVDPIVSKMPGVSFAVDGKCFGVMGDMNLWHRRMRHMSVSQLNKINKHDLVDGFKVKGNHSTACSCDTCAQAKIRRAATPAVSENTTKASYIGDYVSTDLKDVPIQSFQGYRYCLVFVDHYSTLSMCYFMRSKTETSSCLRRYLLEMKRLGVTVRNIQSDRGSEYFNQEGNAPEERARVISQFGQTCAEFNVRHVVRPVEQKEKRAEVFFRDHFKAADAMLWEARLSPAFWVDAVSYSQYLWNRTPNSHTGMSTPWEMLTGRKANWSKMKVFGCDVFEFIANDKFTKVPGLPRGRKMLFMGFDPSTDGWRLFDPEIRRYHASRDAYFYENFKHRIDSLRHFDSRRKIMREGGDMAVAIDDFESDSIDSSDAVRNLFMDPNYLPDPRGPPQGSTQTLTSLLDDESVLRNHLSDTQPAGLREQLHSSADPLTASLREPIGPTLATPSSLRERIDLPLPPVLGGGLSDDSMRAAKARQLLIEGAILRPLRLLPVGQEAPYLEEDRKFLEHVRMTDTPLVYLNPCPKKGNSQARTRYLKYMHAKSHSQARELGASNDDILWDYRRGYIVYPKLEPDLPGHVHCAMMVSDRYGVTHILEDIGRYVQPGDHTDYLLAKAFESKGLARAQFVFNEALKTCFKPGLLIKHIEDRQFGIKWAEHQMTKVFNSTSLKIDFSLAPEPTRFEEVQPEVCAEHERWKNAMDDEITSMVKFGVYRRVLKSDTNGRQLLGCRWVYKRKVGKDGAVTRYRARLVAQGYLQRPYDSFIPEETYSPVVHKDSLRLFLSVAAAESLMVHQADVKAAFLQAPLSERIYMRAPPGYSSVNADGCEEIWELHKAIYGLKQASNAFWNAIHSHLIEKGFESILGDPCLFRRVALDGSVILVCTYIDDVTYAVSSQEAADSFLSELRERFVIDEGEGKPIEWLLGMAVSQDLAAGTVHMHMELAITKLALGILTSEEIVKSRSVRYPMLAQPLSRETENLVPKDQFDYLSVIGSLLHITNCVRPDVAASVGVLSRFSNSPGAMHVRACKRVVMYLYNTRRYGITYRRADEHKSVPLMYAGAQHPLSNGANLLQVFADSDYAGDETRRSTMGTVTMMNGGPISWSSVLGKTVATSTCEAEVNAAVYAAKDALHVSRMLADLGYANGGKPLQIAEDNSACIAQANSGLRHVRNAKHYEVKLRFLQQLVVDKDVEFVYCPTDLQLADIFTKPLDEAKFVYFRDQLVSEAKS
jgi:hypothetical protein